MNDLPALIRRVMSSPLSMFTPLTAKKLAPSVSQPPTDLIHRALYGPHRMPKETVDAKVRAAWNVTQ